MEPTTEPVTIRVGSDQVASGLLLAPADATTGFVFAHGAGAAPVSRLGGSVPLTCRAERREPSTGGVSTDDVGGH